MPKIIERDWKNMLEKDFGHGGGKPLATAMLALMVAFPEDIRRALFDWGQAAERDPSLADNKPMLLNGFVDVLGQLITERRAMRQAGRRDEDPDRELALEHFVDRILDPALLLKSGDDLMRHSRAMGDR